MYYVEIEVLSNADLGEVMLETLQVVALCVYCEAKPIYHYDFCLACYEAELWLLDGGDSSLIPRGEDYGDCQNCQMFGKIGSHGWCDLCEDDPYRLRCWHCGESKKTEDLNSDGTCYACFGAFWVTRCKTCNGQVQLGHSSRLCGHSAHECESCEAKSESLLEDEDHVFRRPIKPRDGASVYRKPKPQKRGKGITCRCPYCLRNHPRKSKLNSTDICFACNDRRKKPAAA